ncbi:esterase-like activity of phytase family protein [Pannus brasiliensis CCIBt3594]|uniref:Esterase-like activity of phytase family protein n=1 Tax=Pannus brasiliensis CCIBt3594 TaxID=1427578 RepID=A0AAW9QUM8_9CHRO
MRLPKILPSALGAIAFLSTPVRASDIQGLTFLGGTTIPKTPLIDGTIAGGLSGITYDPVQNRYYILSDDRSEANPSRFYTASIDLSGGSLSSVTLTGATLLRQSNGQTFPVSGLDPEGIAFAGGNSVFIASEGGSAGTPLIGQFSLSTGIQGQTLPIPAKFLPTATTGVRDNLSLESLTITPNGRYLFSATENALRQDGNTPTVAAGSPSRILQYDLTTNQAIGEYLYNTDPLVNSTGVNGLVDLVALDNSGQNLLALERGGFLGTGGTPQSSIQIFQVSLSGATQISGLNSVAGQSGIIPVQKTLLLDLSTLGISLDNLEGMTLGEILPNGRRSLFLVADDNFSSSQVNQLLAFQVDTTVPEPNAIMGLLSIALVVRGLKKS